MTSREAKLTILNAIYNKKYVLFGKFSDKLTKTDEALAWQEGQEVHSIGKSVGAFCEKDWIYIRDVFWPNARKVTMVSSFTLN